MRFFRSTHLNQPIMYIIRTGLPILVELIYLVNSVTIFLSQTILLRWLTFLVRSQAVTVTVLLFWIFVFLWMLVFVLQWFPSIGKFWSCCCLSFHWLLVKFTTGSPFYCIASDYFCADWDGLCDHLRDVAWEYIFKLSFSAAASEFCEFRFKLMYISIIISIRSSLTDLHGFQLIVLHS